MSKRRPGARRKTLLCIDFDGVLHPYDAHFVVDDVASASAAELHSVGLFVHCQLLADILCAYPDVDLVVHSSWRKTHSLQSLRELLGPLGPRLRAVTPTEFEPEASVIALMKRWRVPSDRVVILDDQPWRFPWLRSHLVLCNGREGLPGVAEELRSALRDRHAMPIERSSFPSAEWMSAVDELVEGVLELISKSGEINSYTSSLGLLDLRRLAEQVRKS